MALVLGEDDDPAVPAVGEVRQGEVDEPVVGAERDCRLGAIEGERQQAVALTTRENHRQDPGPAHVRTLAARDEYLNFRALGSG